jgi:hypothetical protein
MVEAAVVNQMPKPGLSGRSQGQVSWKGAICRTNGYLLPVRYPRDRIQTTRILNLNIIRVGRRLGRGWLQFRTEIRSGLFMYSKKLTVYTWFVHDRHRAGGREEWTQEGTSWNSGSHITRRKVPMETCPQVQRSYLAKHSLPQVSKATWNLRLAQCWKLQEIVANKHRHLRATERAGSQLATGVPRR